MCAVCYLQLSVIHCLFVELSIQDLHLFVEFDHTGVERDQTCALSGVEDTSDRGLVRRGVGHRILTSKLRHESSRSCIHLEIVDEIVFWCMNRDIRDRRSSESMSRWINTSDLSMALYQLRFVWLNKSGNLLV